MHPVDPKDRRLEPRVRSKGTVLLITEQEHSIPATILDVSPSGMRVKASEPLAVGIPLRIEAHGHSASGVVCFCLTNDDSAEVGIKLLSHG